MLFHIPSLVRDNQDIGWFGCVSLSVTCLALSNSVKLIDCATHLNQAPLRSREMSELCGSLLFWDKNPSCLLSLMVLSTLSSVRQ